ncbi:nucleoside deaminase [Sinomicrobium sp. M5D2P9]
MTEEDKKFMRRAIALAKEGMEANAGGPFGAVIVKDGQIIAEGYNQVTSHNDPTAHAEVTAIRKACEKLKSFQLEDCVIYTSCEPCPMCLGAIYWARPEKVYYALNREDAAKIGFDDQYIYDELDKAMELREIAFENIIRNEALPVFEAWNSKENKVDY